MVFVIAQKLRPTTSVDPRQTVPIRTEPNTNGSTPVYPRET